MLADLLLPDARSLLHPSVEAAVVECEAMVVMVLDRVVRRGPQRDEEAPRRDLAVRIRQVRGGATYMGSRDVRSRP